MPKWTLFSPLSPEVTAAQLAVVLPDYIVCICKLYIHIISKYTKSLINVEQLTCLIK